MKNFLNYLGQFRIYSALDLIILLLAAGADKYFILGAVLLNFGFMTHLEWVHKHSYRKQIPIYVPLFFYAAGLFFFRYIEGLVYVILSHIYSLKKDSFLGWFSSLTRGLQTLVIVGAVAGYDSYITWLSFVLILLRNFIGDLRDVSKDEGEGVKTLAVVLGIKRDLKYGHLLALFATTIIWGVLAQVSIPVIALIIIVEWLTYNWTSR